MDYKNYNLGDAILELLDTCSNFPGLIAFVHPRIAAAEVTLTRLKKNYEGINYLQLQKPACAINSK